MAQKPEELLKELGSKLDPPPSSKDSLLKLFKEAAVHLSELEQSPPAAVLKSIQPFLDAVIKPEILRHQDKDVKLLVASCVSEITRITAPEAPYSDDIMRDIFQLIVSAFSGLDDVGGPSFGRRVVILETVAKYRSCVVMLDLECDDLVKEVFTTFLDVARDDHPEVVLSSMQSIMIVLLEESEDIQEQLLLILLSKFGRNRSVSISDDVGDAARRLAMKVIEQCAQKVESDIKQFLISSVSGDSRFSSSQIDYHEVIYDLYRCAPQTLSGIAPYLTGELLADNLDTRLKAVGLVGELFSLPGRVISEEFSSIFLEFLKRLTDRVIEVRMVILDHIKNCLLSDPSRAEASQIISALRDRLLDYDENIRKQVVSVICDVAVSELASIPIDTIKLVAERLRDKAMLVKTYTMERLSELFRVYCLRCTEGKAGTGDFDWIPGKILRCLYDKDFRSDTIEHILCRSLFPSDFSVKDKVKHWIEIFSGFESAETKAFEKILEQRQRVQQEMQKYLSLKQQSADSPEMQKKILFGFRVMSRAFSDPAKTEQNFLILDQLKDANIWKILNNLVDPNTSIMQASKIRDDMLKILSEKHSLYEFLGTLSIKCSYLLFSKEYVKEILAEVSARKASKTSSGIQSCMDFLGLLASFCPSLFDGAEEELIGFLKDDDEIIKEGTLKILAKAGEGNRKKAKYAVHALASITKDDGLKSLSVLYKVAGLVDMLDDKRHQPAVLQSLGCIAQIAMPVFETRETEVVEFIRDKILKSESIAADEDKLSWDDKSEMCQLKIYGIKTLVKSYLPFNDAHLRTGVDDLLELLKNILSFGEVSEDIESSSVDKAHLKLAAAKAVLRLSRHWDDKIPVDIFHLTLNTPEISFPMAKKIFLGKVHQYIKDRVLETKYACSFLFDITGSNVLVSEEEKQNLADIIQHSYQTKVRKVSAQTDANSVSPYPQHILPYLVHALAHLSCPDVEKSKDVEEYELIYRQLHLIISMLLHKEEDGKAEDRDKEHECVPTIISIFRSIKQSEDVTDASKSKNSHAICELGLSIIKHLTQKELDLQGEFTPVSLPPTLYKPCEKNEGDKSQVGEEQLWLADETVLAHFSSLMLESHADISEIPPTTEIEVMDNEDSDGNELPLGKIVERLRAQSRKGKKNKSVPAEDDENGKKEDVDVLKMVREINLDHLKLDKFESSNGHTHSPVEKADTSHSDQKANKRSAGNATSVVSVPKRRRSSSGHSPFKFSSSDPLKASKKELLEERDMDANISSDSDKGKSRSSRKRKKSFSAKLKNSESDPENQSEDGNCSEKSKSAENGDKLKSASGSIKRKRKSIAGPTKCSTAEKKMVTDELIGCRIDVWWPMDKRKVWYYFPESYQKLHLGVINRFYEGTVKSYDSTKKKHVILYEDGDVEVLRLDKEHWELIETKPAKKSSASKRSSNKKGSSESKRKSRSGLQRKEDPIPTTPKGKRTPKKNIKRKDPEGTANSLSLEDEKPKLRTKKNRASGVVEVAEKASEEKMESSTEQMGEDPKYGGEADEEKSESEGKSRKEGEDDEEAEFKEANAESSGDSEEKETAVENSDSEGKQEEIEAEEDAVDAEASDNETLFVLEASFDDLFVEFLPRSKYYELIHSFHEGSSIGPLEPQASRSQQSQQLRSQQSQQSFSQGPSSYSQRGCFSQRTQGSVDELVISDQRFSSQERDHSLKKVNCLPPISHRRDDSQLVAYRSSSGLQRRWSSDSVGESKFTRIFENVKFDVFSKNVPTSDIETDQGAERIQQKLILQDTSLQQLIKEQANFKASLDGGVKSILEELSKDFSEEKLQSIILMLKAIPEQVESALQKMQRDIYHTFTRESQALSSLEMAEVIVQGPAAPQVKAKENLPEHRGPSAKVLNIMKKPEPIDRLPRAPQLTSKENFPEQRGAEAKRNAISNATPKRKQPSSRTVKTSLSPKIQVGGWKTVKPEQNTFKKSAARKQVKPEDTRTQFQQGCIVIDSDEDIDGGFSCMLNGNAKGAKFDWDAEKEAKRLLKMARRTKRKSEMGEPLGLLQVTVIRGKKLVIRDFKSSDPYVIVKLGTESAKTKVINNCLNPVWDEELSFTLKDPAAVLSLEVFDKDRFKADDKMGHATLSLQPLISVARLRHIVRVSSGETTLRKVLPDSDNCVSRESTISCIDGEVVQSVWLKLCAVESGEIELKIKLIDRPGTK
ncbi:hypothetical protein YC2023_074416 [Brassica napus]